MLLKARRQVYTLLSGRSLSKLYGEGYDFAELREYRVGDDIRKINWTVTAKLGTPYVKELHADRELSVSVAAMLDGGVFCDQRNDKQSTIAYICALLGYAAYQGGDLFSGTIFTQKETFSIAPTKSVFEIERFVNRIYEASLLHTNLQTATATEELFRKLLKPSLLFVVGDFLSPVDLSLLAQRHEVIAIVVRHPEEESPQIDAEVNLYDPKSGNTKDLAFTHKAKRGYLAKKEAHDEALYAHFAQHRIRHIKILSDEEPLGKLLALFR